MTPDLTILGKLIGGGLPGRRLRGAARPDGARSPGRRRLPGGHAVGQPAGHGRWAGHARLLDDAAYEASTTPSELAALRDGAAAGRRSRSRDTGCSPSSSPTPGGRLRRRQRCDTEALRRLLPRDARPRRLPAAVAVRGLVPVARALRRAGRADDRGRPRGARRCVSAMTRARTAPALAAPYAVAGRARRVSTRALGDRLFVLEAVYEGYLLHYGRCRACSPRWSPTSGCWPGTRSTPWARPAGGAATCRRGGAVRPNLALRPGPRRGPRRRRRRSGTCPASALEPAPMSSRGPRRRGPIVPLGTMLPLAFAAPQNHLHTRGRSHQVRQEVPLYRGSRHRRGLRGRDRHPPPPDGGRRSAGGRGGRCGDRAAEPGLRARPDVRGAGAGTRWQDVGPEDDFNDETYVPR